PEGRGGRVAMLIGAALILTGLLVAGLLLAGGDASDDEAGPGPGRSDGPSQRDDEDGEDGEGGGDQDGGDSGAGDGFTRAQAGGVALPVPEGWEEGDMDGGVSVTTSGGYPCPVDPELDCVDAGVFLIGVPDVSGVTPEQLALGDIAGNERDSYGPDSYGGIADSREQVSERVTVAGQEGYRVRTRVTTEVGTEAYVESVAFRAPDGSDTLLLLRIGGDIGPDAPEPDVLDRFVQDARVVAAGPGTEV
ncbi:hypothetical protein, partial [Streptomyces hainanensis]|uniref:hypothetical protein n=1 Tax=Streptomyces hainanensis TaxID=402648 RepID=UPI001404E16A